jgi:hypothetical protein
MKPLLLAGLIAGSALQAPAAEWTVPIAGNAYLTAPAPGRLPLDRDGALRWPGKDEAITIYFHIDRPAVIDLDLEASGPAPELAVGVRYQIFKLTPDDSAMKVRPVGRVEVPHAGYVGVALRSKARAEADSGRLRSLKVRSSTAGLTLDFVKSDEGNMFYWGRRGPSVHLGYAMPRDRKIEYAYSELTVPENEDPIGSYFMANGFGQGYFGMQVKSPTERWILFSVWSPFATDNPREIPEDHRVETLARGAEVVVQNFGGEGSGGQSFLRHPWKAGTTYRFLTQVRPDGEGRTTYTGWFGENGGEWKLVASFRRPKTDTWLTGFHSFLENFAPDHGFQARRSFHGNSWVRDTDGTWHELTRARFTGDATAGGRHRLDYGGGVEGGRFFLHNGGFLEGKVPLNRMLERQPTPDEKPVIDLGALPRG